MNPPRVFISYSSNDRQRAFTLAEKLRDRGIEVWIDYDRVDYGDSIPSAISNGLLNADVMLLLISKAWCSSSWCRVEYETQMKKEIDTRNISILPILIDDVDMPPLLSIKKYIDGRQGLDAATFEGLCLRIEELASQRAILSIAEVPESDFSSFSFPSYDSSLLFLIISKTLSKFPPRVITDIEVFEGRTIIELYRVVNSFIDAFHKLVSMVIDTLKGYERLEGEGKKVLSGKDKDLRRHCYRFDQFIVNANRQLVAISSDMRMLSDSLNVIIDRQVEIGQHFRTLGQICIQISVLSIGAIIKLGVPRDIEHLNDRTHETKKEVDLWPCGMAGDSIEATITELNRLLDDLQEYKHQLQKTIVCKESR